MRNVLPYILAAAVILSLLTVSTILGQELSRDDFLTVRNAARTNCAVVNETRERSNALGKIVKRFLLTAAVAREESAGVIADAGGRKEEAEVNLAAARRYRKDADRIFRLNPIDCEESFP